MGAAFVDYWWNKHLNLNIVSNLDRFKKDVKFIRGDK